MTRSARTATMLLVVTLCCAGRAAAQGSGAKPANWYGEVNAAATLGHRSSSSLGAEGGYRVNGDIDVVAEVGHIFTAGSSDLDSRAQRIAAQLGGTGNASYHVTYFDVGARYHIMMPSAQAPAPKFHPYIVGGLGLAAVKAETTIGVNGVTLGSETIAFGNDLNGTVTKFLLVLGGGTTWDFGTRYFIDATYRYGRIFARTGEIEGDQGINTQRVQVGVGIKF
jgi:opacity protein-like surface antigen